MGKGDRKTRRGKIWHKTYGKYRLKPNKKKKSVQARLEELAKPSAEQQGK